VITYGSIPVIGIFGPKGRSALLLIECYIRRGFTSFTGSFGIYILGIGSDGRAALLLKESLVRRVPIFH